MYELFGVYEEGEGGGVVPVIPTKVGIQVICFREATTLINRICIFTWTCLPVGKVPAYAGMTNQQRTTMSTVRGVFEYFDKYFFRP